jgi:hypothetical protein
MYGWSTPWPAPRYQPCSLTEDITAVHSLPQNEIPDERCRLREFHSLLFSARSQFPKPSGINMDHFRLLMRRGSLAH